MTRKARFLAHAALIGGLYAALSYLQNLLIPGSASWAVQYRISEALCVLALFTPAAIPGLSAGCLLFNLSVAGVLPLDFLAGSLATALAAGAMWLTRRWTPGGFPLFALIMPGLFNGWIIGWELSTAMGGGFWLNAASVALGELAVLLSLGSFLYYTLKARHLDSRLFG